MLIREAASHRDLDEAVLIQREVWNIEDMEVVGRIQLKASQHAGGSVLVAEGPDGAILGFAYAFPAFIDGKAFWHSDMLAVRKAHRDTGMGQALKWGQREAALKKGIRRITWTFDPMQAGNAHLNLELLGATVSEYLGNFYGITTSALHHGLPTDRLLADWNLESPRVLALSRGEAPAALPVHSRVGIPAHWNALVERDPGAARSEQKRVEADLRAAFSRGLRIAGFDKVSASYILVESQ
jgi:predicted GNAT superfamily acetyltransferase